ncbi:hypothetical protein BHM03_00014202 [Ensete ventricosum]|nr:hypothetical protein BHM03_00014202 [Ensete ventricosum]
MNASGTIQHPVPVNKDVCVRRPHLLLPHPHLYPQIPMDPQGPISPVLPHPVSHVDYSAWRRLAVLHKASELCEAEQSENWSSDRDDQGRDRQRLIKAKKESRHESVTGKVAL